MIVILSEAKDLTNYNARFTQEPVQDHGGELDERNLEILSTIARSLVTLGMTE